MRIEETERRREITKHLLSKDYVALVRMGLVIEDAASGVDCGYYVLQKLNLPLDPRLLSYILRLSRSQSPAEGSVVIYLNSRGVRHYGLYRDGVVRSKWGHGPAFSHAIEDVPLDYGDSVVFVSVGPEIYVYLQELQMRGAQ